MIASLFQIGSFSSLELISALLGLIVVLVAFFWVLLKNYPIVVVLRAGAVVFLLLLGTAIITGYHYRQTLAMRYRDAENQVKKQELVQNVKDLQTRTASADTTKPSNKVVAFSNDGVDEDAFYDTESYSKQELLKKLNYVEQVLGTTLEEDDDNIQLVKSKYEQGHLGDYEEMTQIAQLEIKKREHVIKAMDKKLDYVNGADYLTADEKKEQAEVFEGRKYQSLREKQDYERILAEVQNHSEIYKKLGN